MNLCSTRWNARGRQAGMWKDVENIFLPIRSLCKMNPVMLSFRSFISGTWCAYWMTLPGWWIGFPIPIVTSDEDPFSIYNKRVFEFDKLVIVISANILLKSSIFLPIRFSWFFALFYRRWFNYRYRGRHKYRTNGWITNAIWSGDYQGASSQ